MRTLIAIVGCALAGGCFGGLRNEAPTPLLYRIDAPKLIPGATLPADLSIVVERAAPGLEGDGLAGRWPGKRLDYIAGARWATDLRELLESALVESFRDSGRLRSVQDEVGRFNATHTLVIEVRRFEADYTGAGPPVAQVALSATLGRNSDRQVLASFTTSASESASENRQAPLVAALDTAFARATADVAAQSFAALEAEPPPALELPPAT
jgi:cholesterol transport system auxiliary component